MKKLLGIVAVVLLIACVVIFYPRQTQQNIQIHIKANSFSSRDEGVSGEVKDVVFDYLLPLLERKLDNAQDLLNMHKNNIQNIINSYLYTKNIVYRCQVCVENTNNKTTNFDTKFCGSYIIISLGKGQGNDNTYELKLKC